PRCVSLHLLCGGRALRQHPGGLAAHVLGPGGVPAQELGRDGVEPGRGVQAVAGGGAGDGGGQRGVVGPVGGAEAEGAAAVHYDRHAWPRKRELVAGAERIARRRTQQCTPCAITVHADLRFMMVADGETLAERPDRLCGTARAPWSVRTRAQEVRCEYGGGGGQWAQRPGGGHPSGAVRAGRHRARGGGHTRRRPDECSAFHRLGVASPYFAALRLERHGLRWRWPEIDLAHPLDDGRAALAGRDPDLTMRSLGADADRWRRMFAWAQRDADGP